MTGSAREGSVPSRHWEIKDPRGGKAMGQQRSDEDRALAWELRDLGSSCAALAVWASVFPVSEMETIVSDLPNT